MNKIYTTIILIILIIILKNLCNKFPIENFESINNKNPDSFIKYYVIHLKGNEPRFSNIKNMQKRLGKPISIFSAILGKSVNLSNIKRYDKNLNITTKFKFKNEIGCYLSHFLLIKQLLNTTHKYTVIFEDDFLIIDYYFDKYLNNILTEIEEDSNFDFDILYNGNYENNYGTHYRKNIYHANKNKILSGTHCYIINNKNILKIYKKLFNIDAAIDNKFSQLCKNNELNILTSFPVTVGNIDSLSTIKT
jgi:GR25 family glycosyltransferase involved in LPS biosynthesis